MRLIAIPTYQEAENICGILERILTNPQLEDVDVVIIDDASPDGTAGLVREHRCFGQRLHLISQQGRTGLGSAYRVAFEWAVERGYDVVVQMDADGSHRPEAVPQLIEALTSADLAIGSRYVAGGSTPTWSRRRRWLSKLANVYARRMLLLSARDCTAGFRAYSKAGLRAVLAGATETTGFAFQVETTWRLQRLGMRITEVPIIFVDREAGSSKMSLAICVEGAMSVLRWRLSDLSLPRVRHMAA